MKVIFWINRMRLRDNQSLEKYIVKLIYLYSEQYRWQFAKLSFNKQKQWENARLLMEENNNTDFVTRTNMRWDDDSILCHSSWTSNLLEQTEKKDKCLYV